MKKYAKICVLSFLCLTLLPAQAFFAVPEKPVPAIPVSLNPIDTAGAIAQQVYEAARRVEEAIRQSEQMEQLNEVMHAQQQALSDQADSHSTETVSASLPGETFPGSAGNDTKLSAGNSLPEAGAETEVETEAETESVPETESELPEETETEFHPVEMGASLPYTGQEQTESGAAGGSDSGQNKEETESLETPPTEEGSGEIDDSVMVPRHGTFAIPQIDGLNEARINLYDYRMLRMYPLSRLPKDLHILYRQLKEQVEAYDGTWSVYVQNLTTGQALVVNDTPMRSASVMKLFIMETVYDAFDRGALPRNEDTVYLLRNMIINSSNDSSNRLLSLLGDGDLAAGVAKVNEFIRLRGFSEGTIEYNGFEDPAASLDPSHPNVIMAKDVGLLLSRVYNRTFLSRKVCNEIEQMMLDQATRYKIPRGLPEGVECGNKSGETDTIANDAAVVYGPTADYILVVLSNDWSNEDTANAQVAEVSAAVYSFFEH